MMNCFDISEDFVAARLDDILALADRGEADLRAEDWLTIALEDSFPCSDPISSMRAD
jgi:hypothetical protein